ncbi:MAG: hypothetical protein H7X80_00490 [bacterium]|nr:hypothetical protein [Candidatus Kapabacteria bacterium]
MRLRGTTILTFLLFVSCGVPAVVPPSYPENILAEPRGTVGVIEVPPSTMLSTALRAIGVPHRVLKYAELDDVQLDGLALVMIDEGAFDDEIMPRALPRLLDRTRTSAVPLFILMQSPMRTSEIMRSNAAPIEPRMVEYDVSLVATQRDHRSLSWPNAIQPNDLAEFSERTVQFARARNGRAIIAGNSDLPDSSAALLRVPYGKGALWYVSFPFIDRAAEGYAADQRMLANLISVE